MLLATSTVPAPVSEGQALRSARAALEDIGPAHTATLRSGRQADDHGWEYFRAPTGLPVGHKRRLPKPSVAALEAAIRTREALIHAYQSGNWTADNESEWSAVQDALAHIGNIQALAAQIHVGPLLRERGLPIKALVKKVGTTTAKMTAALEANGYVTVSLYGGRQRRVMASAATIAAGYGTNVHLTTRHGPSVMPVFYRGHVDSILWTLEPDLKEPEKAIRRPAKALQGVDELREIGLPYVKEALVCDHTTGDRVHWKRDVVDDPAYAAGLADRGVTRTAKRGQGGTILTIPTD